MCHSLWPASLVTTTSNTTNTMAAVVALQALPLQHQQHRRRQEQQRHKHKRTGQLSSIRPACTGRMGLGGVLLLLLVASVQVLAAGAATNRVCTPRSLQPALHNIEATDCVSYAPVLLPGVQVNPDAALENSPTLATTEVPHHHMLPGSWQLQHCHRPHHTLMLTHITSLVCMVPPSPISPGVLCGAGE